MGLFSALAEYGIHTHEHTCCTCCNQSIVDGVVSQKLNLSKEPTIHLEASNKFFFFNGSN